MIKKILKIILWIVGIVVILFIGLMIAVSVWPKEGGEIKTAQHDFRMANCGMAATGEIPGFAIPAATTTPQKYEMFFYRLSFGDQVPVAKPKVQVPGIAGEFDLKGIGSCQIFKPGTTTISYSDRYAPEAGKLPLSDIDSKIDDYYLSLSRVANSYWTNDQTYAAKNNANDFFDQFLYLTEPGFKPFYHQLNPDFWKWIEKITGRRLAVTAADELLYSSKSSYGLCSRPDGADGGCYTELYLYRGGEFIEKSGFLIYSSTSSRGIRSEEPIIDRQLGENFANLVAQKIKDAGLMEKDCPLGLIMDAGWDYEINLNGVTKIFRNPPSECKDEFDKIDKLIEGWLPF
ncbi:MAG: hypothetical protein PHE24_04130 [Patescibacteria group bacterium]|nr:hypothetical protein [Patescibacteria group bacterium]